LKNLADSNPNIKESISDIFSSFKED